MKCKVAMEQYMALDKDKHVPLLITIHLLKCKKCRDLVRSMSIAAKLYEKNIYKQDIPDYDFLLKTMKKVDDIVPELMKKQAEKYKLPHERILTWVVIGFLMILGLTSIPFTYTGRWASSTFEMRFVLPLALISAIFVSVFAAMFVGRNLDFFIKKFDLVD